MKRTIIRAFLVLCLVFVLSDHATWADGRDEAECHHNGSSVVMAMLTVGPIKVRTVVPTGTSILTAAPPIDANPATATLAPRACLPSGSIGIVVQGKNATAYAPKGNWDGGPSGVNVVPVETSAGIGKGDLPVSVTTAGTVNSCSSNLTTGQTVCISNNTDVFLITGTTLTKTLTSGASGRANFPGGSCMNCGVVVDSATNTAIIAMGLSSTDRGGYQLLDLATGTFTTPIPAGTGISEGIVVDPLRHLILSPNESISSGSLPVANYEIVQAQHSAAVFENRVVRVPAATAAGAPAPSTFLDSAGEDCTTGIALSTNEGSGSLFIADLSQAKFAAGVPTGTWSAPSRLQNFAEFDSDFLSAGISGIAVAPGTHFGIVTGGFGGNIEGVIELPSRSGSGTPAVVDWVQFTVPNDPSGLPWSQGFDPHALTAYVSPNSKKALAVLGNGDVTFLAVVDLAGLLKAPRTLETHVIDPTLDLVKAGLVTFVAQ